MKHIHTFSIIAFFLFLSGCAVSGHSVLPSQYTSDELAHVNDPLSGNDIPVVIYFKDGQVARGYNARVQCDSTTWITYDEKMVARRTSSVLKIEATKQRRPWVARGGGAIAGIAAYFEISGKANAENPLLVSLAAGTGLMAGELLFSILLGDKQLVAYRAPLERYNSCKQNQLN